jgi:DNA mismatch endonuclease (patch repair protein)
MPADEKISHTMSAIRAKNTKPELAVRKILLSAGINKYRLNYRKIPGSPDIVFPKKRVAIFINGCFWHGCPYCKLKLPKTHRKFWKDKITANKLRDTKKINELKKSGWRPLVIWACRLETRRNQVLRRIQSALK